MATVCSMLDSRLSHCNDIVTTGAYSAEELLQATKGIFCVVYHCMSDSTVLVVSRLVAVFISI